MPLRAQALFGQTDLELEDLEVSTQQSTKVVVRSQREEASRFGYVVFPYSFTIDPSPQSDGQGCIWAEHSSYLAENGIQVSVGDVEE